MPARTARSRSPRQTSPFTAGCLPLPNSTLGAAILAYQSDLYTVNSGTGIFTAVTGSAPNRQFIVEWRAQYFPGTGSANFEIIFDEATGTYEERYGATDDNGSGETVGLQASGTGATNIFSCGEAGTPSGLRVRDVPDANYGNNVARSQGIVPGTTNIGNSCDDCTTPITLPFSFTYYGATYTSAFASSNGNLQLTGKRATSVQGACRTPSLGAAICPIRTTSIRPAPARGSSRPRSAWLRTASS